jgi:hypothetical protein
MTKTDLNVFVPVQEDWYPSFKIDYQGEILLVHVTLHESCLLQSVNPFIRVSIWGEDDCGMDKDYLPTEMDKAIADWLMVIQKKNMTREWLKEQGFNYF